MTDRHPDFIDELIRLYDEYSTDTDVLYRTYLPEGVPILSFEGFIAWLKTKKVKEKTDETQKLR